MECKLIKKANAENLFLLQFGLKINTKKREKGKPKERKRERTSK